MHLSYFCILFLYSIKKMSDYCFRERNVEKYAILFNILAVFKTSYSKEFNCMKAGMPSIELLNIVD